MSTDNEYEGYLADEPGELDPRGVWRAAERYLCKKYDLIPDHGKCRDARTQDGKPVELKSCQARHSNGRVGKFKIWMMQHLEIGGADGLYGVLVYSSEERYPVVTSHMVQWCEMTGSRLHKLNNPPVSSFFCYPKDKTGLLVHPWPSVIKFRELDLELQLRFPFGWEYSDDEEGYE